MPKLEPLGAGCPRASRLVRRTHSCAPARSGVGTDNLLPKNSSGSRPNHRLSAVASGHGYETIRRSCPSRVVLKERVGFLDHLPARYYRCWLSAAQRREVECSRVVLKERVGWLTAGPFTNTVPHLLPLAPGRPLVVPRHKRGSPSESGGARLKRACRLASPVRR